MSGAWNNSVRPLRRSDLSPPQQSMTEERCCPPIMVFWKMKRMHRPRSRDRRLAGLPRLDGRLSGFRAETERSKRAGGVKSAIGYPSSGGFARQRSRSCARHTAHPRAAKALARLASQKVDPSWMMAIFQRRPDRSQWGIAPSPRRPKQVAHAAKCRALGASTPTRR